MIAERRVATSLLVALVVTLCTGAEPQPRECTSVLVNLTPCMDYLARNSSIIPQICCSQLAAVDLLSPRCLCEVLNGGGASFGVNINITRALELPGNCKVQIQSINRCNVEPPLGSPAGSPGLPTPAAGPGPSLRANDSSDAISLEMTSLSFFLVFIAAYATTSTMF